MEICFEEGKPQKGVCVVGVFEEGMLEGFTREIDQHVRGVCEKWIKTSSFKGKIGQAQLLALSDQDGFDQIVLLGLGTKGTLKEHEAYKIGGALTSCLSKLPCKSASLVLDQLTEEQNLWVAFGALLRSWRFDRYLTGAREHEKMALTQLTLHLSDPHHAKNSFETYRHLANSIMWSRDLISEPGNTMYPAVVVERAKELEQYGAHVEILDKKEMAQRGMGALLGVAQGSTQDPYLAIVEWKGTTSQKAPVAFVGKGVTFDSGGLSLKPSSGMEDMKCDMAGAAVVLGLMRNLVLRKAPVHAVCVVALVENMPSGTAQRPGDIVRSMSGQTIEVLNTDAEGRLILADALWYTQDRFQPQCMIDVATLTGAVVVALGDQFAGVFSNQDALTQELKKAGDDVGEFLWHLPLSKGYDKAINSAIADMKNIAAPGCGAGSSIAAQFLHRFIGKTTWAHLDIAALDCFAKATPLAPKGPTAFGVMLLNRWIKDNIEAKPTSN